MTVQTSYTKNIRQAINGQVAWDFGTADITSHDAEATVPFGASVIKGTASRSVIVGNTTTLVLGIATRSLINEESVTQNTQEYATTETVSVLRSGYIFLDNNSPATALVEGDQAFFNAVGLLVDTGDAGAVALVGSRIEQGGAAGEIILMRLLA